MNSIHKERRNFYRLSKCKEPSFQFGVLLVLVFSVFTAYFARSEMFPQYGWWHYYAWRMEEREVLYKDLFLFIPPYFAFLTNILYKLFSTRLMNYVLFIGFPIKLMCLLILYSVFQQYTKPVCAFGAVLTGACLSASYLMDNLYDYNPISNLPVLLLAVCIMRFYEYKDNTRNRAFASVGCGLIVGLLLMFKQTLGIGLGAVIVIMILVLNRFWKESIRRLLGDAAWIIIGFSIGVAPAVFYLSYHGIWNDFFSCLSSATGSKGGMEGLFSHFITIMTNVTVWIPVLMIFMAMVFCNRIWGVRMQKLSDTGVAANHIKTKAFAAYFTIVGIIACLTLLSAKLEMFYEGIKQTSLSSKMLFWVLASSIIFAAVMEISTNCLTQMCDSTKWMVVFGLFILILVAFWGKLSTQFHSLMYCKTDFFYCRRILISLCSYLTILLWLKELYAFFSKKPCRGRLLMFLTILVAQMSFSIIGAAEIEELFSILYVPWALIELLNWSIPHKAIKNMLLFAVMVICILLSLSSKITIPYDWQGWREPEITADFAEPDVDGLQGFNLSSETNEAYSEIVRIINENTTEEDRVFQFANSPLFNVITHRNMRSYAPITWFDVCPDDVAREVALSLYRDPPKVLIWNNIDDAQWNVLESVYRNGNRSGQRYIQQFYNTVVLKNYKQEFSVYNGRDGYLEVWVLKENTLKGKQYFEYPIMPEQYAEQDCTLFSGGEGTLDNPYLLDSREQLILLSETVNQGRSFSGQFIKQTADIDLEGITFLPIGLMEGKCYFEGTYDGAGHVIRNLTIDTDDGLANNGLFGMLMGSVYNLGLEGGNISGNCCGTIASHSTNPQSEIVNCYSTVDVSGVRAGGIADNFCGSVRNCFSIGKLNGVTNANAISYVNAREIKAVYIEQGSMNIQVHSSLLQDERISLFADEFLDTDYMVNLMNAYVDETNDNQANQGDPITVPQLVSWKRGEKGHPVFNVPNE